MTVCAQKPIHSIVPICARLVKGVPGKGPLFHHIPTIPTNTYGFYNMPAFLVQIEASDPISGKRAHPKITRALQAANLTFSRSIYQKEREK